MNQEKIGKFIASRRKNKKLTQEQLAKKLFVTDKAVSKWERGLSLPDITLLKKLAQILKVDIADVGKYISVTNKPNGSEVFKVYTDNQLVIVDKTVENDKLYLKG